MTHGGLVTPAGFLSTPSARRATSKPKSMPGEEVFLSTPSARRATAQLARDLLMGAISIHALREEGDVCAAADLQGFVISIHALREEGDPSAIQCSAFSFLFLSTPSARRATKTAHESAVRNAISIHALREEGD